MKIDKNILTEEKVKEIKSYIYVYKIPSMDSLGIFISGSSKEEAIEEINKELWSDIYPDYKKNKERIKELENVKVWTWEEYQKLQGKVFFQKRILEIIN